MVGAQNSNGVFHIARVNRISPLQQVVQFAEELPRKRLLGVIARDLEAAPIDSDSNPERLLDRADVAIVLPEQFREETMVVEVKFDRILVG